MDTLQSGSAHADVPPERLSAVSPRLRLTLSVTGLKAGDEDAVKAEQALEQLPGVIHAYVNPVTEMAYIEYDPDVTAESELAAALDSAEFRKASGCAP
jgi:cation transport ATPase